MNRPWPLSETKSIGNFHPKWQALLAPVDPSTKWALKDEAGEADSVEAEPHHMEVGDEVAEAGEVEEELLGRGQTVLS
jgi:hypothetical protein